MSVTRIAQTLQPAVLRSASLFSNAFSTAALQSWVKRAVAASSEAADVLVALITPSAVIALVMGIWRLTADIAWTDTFPVSSGFFSHWQVWIALAIGLKFGASVLAAKLNPPASVE